MNDCTATGAGRSTKASRWTGWPLWVGVWLLLAVWSAPGQAREVVFIPQWIPQAQFAGYYAAQEKGFYRDRGLAVTILRGGPERDAADWLTQKRADFGTMMLTTGIVRRAGGARLVNLAQIVQRSALMLVARKSAGIHDPRDLAGRKVSLWGGNFRLQFETLFKKLGIQVQEVPQGTTLNLFLRGGVEAAAAMWYNEYHLLLNAGMNPDELTTFFLADYGLNFPEDGLYCREELWQKEPEVCRAFVQATLAGWRWVFAHRDEALDIVMQYVDAAHGGTNRMHQQWMLARMAEIIQPPQDPTPLGHLDKADYQLVARDLQEYGFINRLPAYGDFFPGKVSDP